jgi:hypothetical protein
MNETCLITTLFFIVRSISYQLRGNLSTISQSMN